MAPDNLAASIDDAHHDGDERGREYFRAEPEKIGATLTDPGSETALARLCAMPTEKSGKKMDFRKQGLSKKRYLNPYNHLRRINAAAFDSWDSPAFFPRPCPWCRLPSGFGRSSAANTPPPDACAMKPSRPGPCAASAKAKTFRAKRKAGNWRSDP